MVAGRYVPRSAVRVLGEAAVAQALGGIMSRSRRFAASSSVPKTATADAC